MKVNKNAINTQSAGRDGVEAVPVLPVNMKIETPTNHLLHLERLAHTTSDQFF